MQTQSESEASAGRSEVSHPKLPVLTRPAAEPGVLAGAASPSQLQAARSALRTHWPEYLMEAAGLGVFMMSACVFGALLYHSVSPLRHAIPGELPRRILMGLAMGLTAIGIIYSPWGQQSGAHLNPSVTLTFLRLKKIQVWDAVFYVASQFVGGVTGVTLVALALGKELADPAVNYVVTVPGMKGITVAFVTETILAFITMSMVLHASNHPRLSRFTGLFAGGLVATYITVAAPLSGMSINPARTVASALPANVWTAAWIYFTAPSLGMLAAAELYLLRRGEEGVYCAKLFHHNHKRCIFRCRFHQLQAKANAAGQAC
jgi:aquaporin Z